MTVVLFAVAGSSCRPPGTEFIPLAPAGEECSCAAVGDILDGNRVDNWSQDSKGPGLRAPEVVIFKQDRPKGEGRKIRTLCPGRYFPYAAIAAQ